MSVARRDCAHHSRLLPITCARKHAARTYTWACHPPDHRWAEWHENGDGRSGGTVAWCGMQVCSASTTDCGATGDWVASPYCN